MRRAGRDLRFMDAARVARRRRGTPQKLAMKTIAVFAPAWPIGCMVRVAVVRTTSSEGDPLPPGAKSWNRRRRPDEIPLHEEWAHVLAA